MEYVNKEIIYIYIEFILRMLHMDMFACSLHKLKGKSTNLN